MCTQKPPHDYSQQLYEKYRDAFVEYIDDMVLPLSFTLHLQKRAFLFSHAAKRYQFSSLHLFLVHNCV
jgi:hypothetical protein